MDVGCGTGFDPINYSSWGAKTVVGLDLSLDSLRIARRRSNSQRVHWVLGDAEHLPFAEGSFEFVSAIGSLHHTPNTEESVSEIYRVLKANGKTAVMLYNKAYLTLYRRTIGEASYDEGAPIVKFYTKDDVRRIFGKFRVEAIRVLGGLPLRTRILPRLLGPLLERHFGWAHYMQARKV